MENAREQIVARLADRLAELKITENDASTRAGLERTFLSQFGATRPAGRASTISSASATRSACACIT